MSLAILIADDSDFIRRSLRKILEEEPGWTVVGEAENGEEAISQYKTLKPDLMTMDITMPRVTGLEALKSIRAYDPEARVVICSALRDMADVKAAIDLGAKGFITKPVIQEFVRATIEKAIAPAADS